MAVGAAGGRQYASAMSADSGDTLSPESDVPSTGSPAEEAPGGDPLLPGEAPDSPYAEDCEHWIEVYRELIRFAQTVDGAEALVERYERRLRFWTERKAAPPG
jgi:hypothetical protein